jgi:hypothetical protein
MGPTARSPLTGRAGQPTPQLDNLFSGNPLPIPHFFGAQPNLQGCSKTIQTLTQFSNIFNSIVSPTYSSPDGSTGGDG